MFTIYNYSTAIFFSVLSMLFWGSWANSQKITSKTWRFELFNWDYSIGVLVTAVITALTLGSFGSEGRSFFEDIYQAHSRQILNVLLGAMFLNVANILLVTSITLVGMTVTFLIGMSINLFLGVLVNYLQEPSDDPMLLFLGVFLILISMLINFIAYRSKKIVDDKPLSKKGLVITVLSGFIMAFFYKMVVGSIFPHYDYPKQGYLSPYTAFFVCGVGIFLSNCIFNSLIMFKPLVGVPVKFRSYFEGNLKDHLSGLLGGFLWSLGMICSLISLEKSGDAVSFGLSTGANVIASLWGIFVWKEFEGTSVKVKLLLCLMLILYIVGLVFIAISKK